MITTVSDERIEKMRTKVMHTIDADIRRRARRARRVLAGTVAAAFVVVVAGTGLDLPGPSGADSSAADSGGASLAEPGPAAEGPAADDSGSTASRLDGAAVERQVITTGQATVVVRDPQTEASRVTGWVERLGGRVDARSEFGDDQTSTTGASLTLRIPGSRLDQAVERLRDSGRMTDLSFTDSDVTSETVDLDARIRSLRISIDRLEDILRDAATSSQVIEAENALTQRQAELESLTSQRKTLGEQVDLATIDVSLVQRGGVDDIDPSGFRGGLTRGWNALVGAVNVLVEGAGALLPWLGVGVVGWLGWRGYRRLRR